MAPTIVSPGRPHFGLALQPFNLVAGTLTIFIMGETATYSQYAVCAGPV
jgi:hypothetical protein